MNWVKRVGFTALATLALGEVARRNNLPGRLWNDHGDVSLNPHMVSDMELSRISAYFRNRTDGLKAELSFFADSKEKIEAAKQDGFRGISDSLGNQYYLDLDEQTQKRTIWFTHDRFLSQKPSDQILVVGMSMPSEYFLEQRVDSSNPKSYTPYGKGAGIFLGNVVPELKTMLDLAISNREERLEDYINSKNSGYSR